MGCFADDPVGYFGSRSATAHHLSPEEQESLQIEAIRQRFSRMRDAIPPLKSLADSAGIESIGKIEDAAALLFPHSFYKSYPESWLEELRFPELTAWLQRWTTVDLSAVLGRAFPTIDAWLDALDETTELHICHSSGTSGRLSFFPRGKCERAFGDSIADMALADWLDAVSEGCAARRFDVIWPSFVGGHTTGGRAVRYYRDIWAHGPAHFHPLIHGRMSADLHYRVMQESNAQASGASLPPMSEYVFERLKDAKRSQALHSVRMEAMMQLIVDELRERPVLIASGPVNLYAFAREGLRRGLENVLAPGSAVITFGGLKGNAAPPDLEPAILRFFGVPRLLSAYGMTEFNGWASACVYERFHIPPWLVPFVIDPASGRLLPRAGVQKGRAAFMDLSAQTYWGGVVSSDRLEISWMPCACGRTTPHIGPDIGRFEDGDGSDQAFGASPPEGIHAALAAAT